MYEPEVDDYVVWERPNGDWEEGWVYFKGDPPVKKRGFPETPRYITIEVSVGINLIACILVVNLWKIRRFILYYYVMKVVGVN